MWYAEENTKYKTEERNDLKDQRSTQSLFERQKAYCKA